MRKDHQGTSRRKFTARKSSVAERPTAAGTVPPGRQSGSSVVDPCQPTDTFTSRAVGTQPGQKTPARTDWGLMERTAGPVPSSSPVQGFTVVRVVTGAGACLVSFLAGLAGPGPVAGAKRGGKAACGDDAMIPIRTRSVVRDDLFRDQPRSGLPETLAPEKRQFRVNQFRMRPQRETLWPVSLSASPVSR